MQRHFTPLSFWVVADVTNHSYKEKTNYHYFDLVEKAEDSNQLLAKVSGKAWGNGANRIMEFERITGQKFTNNINVLVKVKVAYHIVYGLSLDIQDIDTSFTLGVLEQQRQATLAKLLNDNPAVIQQIADGYITRNSALPLPRVIQRIAVVSSKTSAGNQDFRHTLENNTHGYRFFIDDYHTVVQNEANASVFLESLVSVFTSGIPYDVVVINRGGGAQTDFLIFDNYKIGLAVAKFPIPIITGIGHQKNETIADLMAHTATKTPTKAAEFIIAHNRQFEDAVVVFQKAIIIKSQQLLSLQFQRLTIMNTGIVNNARTYINHHKDALVSNNQIVINQTKSLLFKQRSALTLMTSTLVTKPKIMTGSKMHELKTIVSNINTFKASYLKNQQGYLAHYVSVINLMSPDNILKKGFAIVKHNGKITSDPKLFKEGENLEIILSEKSIQSTIQSINNHDGREFNL